MTFFILTFIYPVSMDRNHSLSSPAYEKVSPVPWQLRQNLSLITLYFTVRNIRHLYQLSSLVACCFESLMRGQWCTRDTWSDISARGSCPVKTRGWCGLLSAQQARPIIQTFDTLQTATDYMWVYRCLMTLCCLVQASKSPTCKNVFTTICVFQISLITDAMEWFAKEVTRISANNEWYHSILDRSSQQTVFG